MLMFTAASPVQAIHGFFQLLRRFFNTTSCLDEKGHLAVYLTSSIKVFESLQLFVRNIPRLSFRPNTHSLSLSLLNSVNTINQSIEFIISVAHCRLDFTINSSIQI